MDPSEKTRAEARGAAVAATHLERHRQRSRQRGRTKDHIDVAKEKSAFATFPVVSEEVDPNVAVAADVQASISGAEAAAGPACQGSAVGASKGKLPDFRTAVTDQDVQDARDRYLDSLEAAGKGKRQQPRMINRLRATDVIVQREIADGTPFAVAPNSIMNRKVREWLNAKAAQTRDDKKSRRKQITGDAVRVLLRQIRQLFSADGD
jgi:hypothetical protein